MSLIQAYDARALEARRTTAAGSCRAGMRSLVGGAAVPEALIRAFDKHGIWIVQGWGMTETSPRLHDLVSARRIAGRRRRRALPARRDGRRARAARRLAHPRRRRSEQPWDGKSVGEIQVRGPFITGSYHEVPVAARQVHRRRLAAHGRRRVGGRTRLRAHHRPHQGPDQVRRRVDQLRRSRERVDGASRGRRSGGDRDPRREVERAAARVRRAASRARQRRPRTSSMRIC